MVNLDAIDEAVEVFKISTPFNHCVIDNFLDEDVASKVASEFPTFDSQEYNGNYNNQIELKKTCNIWDRFLPNTYKLLAYLNSNSFVKVISKLTGCKDLQADPGLHGGGWHTHPVGGKLNPHLDYNIHPKLGLQRKFNLLIYLTPEWNTSWGGHFGLWNSKNEQPTELSKSIAPLYNRAILFDTTQDSWHGLATEVSCPTNKTRNSIAVYYLRAAPKNTSNRKRALFAPTVEQKGNKEILDLIERRSRINGNDVEKWERK